MSTEIEKIDIESGHDYMKKVGSEETKVKS